MFSMITTLMRCGILDILLFSSNPKIKYILKKVINISQDIYDLFLFVLLIFCDGNNSPPTFIQFQICKLNGGNKDGR